MSWRKLKMLSLLFVVLASFSNVLDVSNVKATVFLEKREFKVEPIEISVSTVNYAGANYLSFPRVFDDLTYPMGITYDCLNDCVWIALYWNESILRINKVSDIMKAEAVLYKLPRYMCDGYYGPMPWTLIVVNNTLWFSIRGIKVRPLKIQGTRPFGVAKLDITSNNVTYYYSDVLDYVSVDLKYTNGYLWILTALSLYKMDVVSEAVISTYALFEEGDGFIAHENNVLWITNVKGTLRKFDIEKDEFTDVVYGLNRPLGLCLDENYVYVAENGESVGKNASIVRVDKKTLSKERIYTNTIIIEGGSGTYHVLKDKYGNLWYTTVSKSFGRFSSLSLSHKRSYEAISRNCYFMTEVYDSIWFSVKGSVYIGIMSRTVKGGGILKAFPEISNVR